MAGYSGKALDQKLGIKPGMKAALLGAPPGYRAMLPAALVFTRLGAGMDFIQLFESRRAACMEKLKDLRPRLAPQGMLWLCWPKKTSALRRDLDEAQLRLMGIAAGLVDVKVCAIDEDWSGLKFVIPLKDRR